MHSFEEETKGPGGTFLDILAVRLKCNQSAVMHVQEITVLSRKHLIFFFKFVLKIYLLLST